MPGRGRRDARQPGRGRRDARQGEEGDANRGEAGTASREGGGAGAAAGRRRRPGPLGPRGAGRSPAPPRPRPGARLPAPRSALRSARRLRRCSPERAGEAQGASAKSEELNNELGIGAGSVAPFIRQCDRQPRGRTLARPRPTVIFSLYTDVHTGLYLNLDAHCQERPRWLHTVPTPYLLPPWASIHTGVHTHRFTLEAFYLSYLSILSHPGEHLTLPPGESVASGLHWHQ
jgi:hypothetical protein